LQVALESTFAEILCRQFAAPVSLRIAAKSGMVLTLDAAGFVAHPTLSVPSWS
jgi:hypothetical protein